ncbi:MAG TPA: fused MFS/spermidine synthase, partial [Chthoniobacterales bacterium]
MSQSLPRSRISPLLFLSGFSALLYQTTWLREFRLIFGASTAATAAVLAIFMGGLGLGSALLGTKVEENLRPLRLYARLELAIAIGAALSPLLLYLVQHTYIALGGTVALGPVFGAVVRILLSALAIGGPAFLMGGTLPAAVRAAVPEDDDSRHTVAFLYGVNTLGAVFGAIGATFYFFDKWGNHATIILAVAINGVVALAAWWFSRTVPPITAGKTRAPENPMAPAGFVYVAAGITGFVFLLMEIVWYRMLAPLLGGSAFTFGLILAVALLGIGLGGMISTLFSHRSRRSLTGFALVCAVQAFFIALPYALGDRIALTTMFLRSLGSFGFYGHVCGWALVCLIVILPAAIASGIQFPTLISLLGRGRDDIGLQTGRAYSWNAIGAIVGSLAGGFGLLPLLSAPGVWRFSVIILGILVISSTVIAARRHSGIGLARHVPSILVIALALCLIRTTGPTAFWRHGQIGAGRLERIGATKNDYRDLINSVRREICWEADGIESSVAMGNSHGLGFLVNGRADGHSTGDAGTQVMLGLIPTALYPTAEQALVIGLGTGSTAGWIGASPAIKQVDVVELEPAMVNVAQSCSAVNLNVLQNPKVNVIFGDGREFILTTGRKYDLIASEPSNPYRAGVASLFTREFYQAAAGALNQGGVFAQWVQAYEIDVQTVQTVYATLGSVFPHIETWQTTGGDMLFLAGLEPHPIDIDDLRERLNQQPFRNGILHAWNTTRLEGFLAHFVGNNSLARAMSQGNAGLNTDDRTMLEFSFARNVNKKGVQISELRAAARLTGAERPTIYDGKVDWNGVDRMRMLALAHYSDKPSPEAYADSTDANRVRAYNQYFSGYLENALAYWKEDPHAVEDILDIQMLAECLADAKSDDAPDYIAKLRKLRPTDAEAIEAHYLLQRGEFEPATRALEQTFLQARSDPWVDENLVERTLTVALRVAQHSRSESFGVRLFKALQQPFSVFNNEEKRRITLLDLGRILDHGTGGKYSLEAIESVGPNVPWQLGFLELRKECYSHYHDLRLAQADKDLR